MIVVRNVSKGCCGLVTPNGEVRDAWYAKEGVRDIYQIGDAQLAAEVHPPAVGGSPGPVTATGGEQSRAHYRSLGHPDR